MSDNDAPASPASSVKETAVADVQLNDDGAPSQVNGYRVLKQLGEGTTSKVYQCQDESGRDYALKILNKSFLKRKREYKKIDGKMVFSNAFQKVQKEVAIMKKLSHDNLVKLHEIIDSPADDKMVLVLELITGGQVMKWEEKGFRYRCLRTDSGVMDHDNVRRCMRDVIDALDYLHKNAICHRDIKPENILLAAADTYKLADFGVAHMTDDAADKKTLRNTEGTYHFLAPECTTGDEYDPYSVDIWALGVTMFTMLFGTLPFGTKAASLTDVMDSIRVDPLVLDAESIEADCEHVLRAMMTKNANERITIDELKRHPWIVRGVVPKALTEPVKVEVTREEIEAAFTPVNNFILMVRIKMKMAGRLARARNSIDHARSQSSVTQGDHDSKGLRRIDSSGPLSLAPHEALPSIEHKPSDGATPNHTSEATSTATLNVIASPALSPGKAAIAMLTRRLSSRSEPTAPAEPPCDALLPVRDGGASPTKSPNVGLTKRKSGSEHRLVSEEPRANTQTSPLTVGAASRGPLPHLSLDKKLPKLDIGFPESPSSSPSASPIHRQLTPRFSRENVATGWDESDEDELEYRKKSPTEKRHRSPKLHQGVVHPAPPAIDAVTTGDGNVTDATEGTITVLAPHHSSSSPTRKKTQDEAKVAISNIVHRTNAETTSPTTSPVKEPSVMLQRRKSSLPPSTAHLGDADSSHTSSADQPATVPELPRLADHTERPRRQESSALHEINGLAIVAKVPGKPSRTTLSNKFPPSRARGNERSVCSNGRASTYTTEYMDTNGPHSDENDREQIPDEVDNHASPSHGVGGASESAKTPRLKNVRITSLANCLPNPNDSELFVVDPLTRHVRKYTKDENEMRSTVTDGDVETAATPSLPERSPAKGFGLFRRTSNNNVAPLDLIPDVGEFDHSDGVSTDKNRNETGDVVPHAPVSPKLKTPTSNGVSVSVSGEVSVWSPTARDLGPGSLPSNRRMFSPRKSMIQSQESIRLLVLRRSESVKAMLTGKKTGLEAADDSLDRRRSRGSTELGGRGNGPSVATVHRALSPKKPRTATVKSASCAVQ